MDFIVTSQKINQAVREADNILLVTHQRPDVDALGSLIVFTEWLDDLNKNWIIFCPDNLLLNNDFSFFINPEFLVTEAKALLKQEYDLIIVFDAGDLKHAGIQDLLPQFSSSPTLINIDHHATNQNFGDINLVNPQAASTTEILYQFFKTAEVTISPKMATALLAGIIFDTYNFTNPNTTYNSLEIASRLLLAGAKLPQLSSSVLKDKTIDILKCWGKVLIRLSRHPQLNIVTTVVTTQDLENHQKEDEVTDGIADFLNSLTGVKAVLILRQQEPGLIKGSLRTNDNLIDVAKLATILGGGGHKKAAGFKIKGELVETVEGQWQII